MLVDQVFDRLGVHPLVLQQIEDDARVERPCACPHRQSVHCGEAHRGGDAAPAIDRAHAGAIAEMGDYELPIAAIGRYFGQCRHDVFIGKAVKAVAPNTLCSELTGQCEFLRQRRLAAMECSVKAGDLRHLGSDSADCADGSDMVWLVQWGERYQGFERGDDFAVDQHRLRVNRPAMDDTMAHSVETSLAADMRREPIVDSGDGAGMAVPRNRPIGQLFPLRVGDPQMRQLPNALDLAMRARRKGPAVRGFEYREFDAGRPGIDNEDRFAHRSHPASLPDPAAVARREWE